MRILIVDDDTTLAEVAGNMLTHSNHDVETSVNGTDALRVYCGRLSAGKPFDFVLTGILIPGMNGPDLIEAILQQNPKQRWGFFTSHQVLSKPFDRAQLLAFVENGG